ncbi:MAG TPA: hypothetical protein VJV03_08505 [Pyrinomonadaceae bacterium]|nr:hypothetical protein [Pyrinomonadaceae bacterium]
MKKQADSTLPSPVQAPLDFIIGHIIGVIQEASHRKQTKTRKLAAQILSRCLINRFADNHPLPFDVPNDTDHTLEASQLWVSGDLTRARGGPEFMYVYLPIRFVEDLLAEAQKVASAPIKASTDELEINGQLSKEVAASIAETFTTAGTVYLLNNLRDKLGEAIEDLFQESRIVVEELYKGSLESSLSELEDKEVDPIEISQSRFADMIKVMVREGNSRKRKRLRAALWEIARGRGRPKGTAGSGISRRFGKTQFSTQLSEKIRSLSQVSESEITRAEVSLALGLPNAKALDRLRRRFEDHRPWRQYVAEVLAGS